MPFSLEIWRSLERTFGVEICHAPFPPSRAGDDYPLPSTIYCIVRAPESRNPRALDALITFRLLGLNALAAPPRHVPPGGRSAASSTSRAPQGRCSHLPSG